MDAITSLSDKFPAAPMHRIIALRAFRPHPGIFFENDEIELNSEQTIEEAMAGANTNGIDIMIIVLRQLLSFDFGIKDVREGAGTDGNTLLAAADKDLGWKQEDDWRIKQHLVRELGIQHDITFKDLLSHPSLDNLFRQNLYFRVVSRIIQVMTPAGETWSRPQAWSEELVNKNILRFDSSKPLAKSLTDHFDPYLGRQYTSLRPMFLCIEYNVTSPRPISELRTLPIRAPEVREIDGKIIKGIQEEGYRLCLVVRVTSAKMERVRVYEFNGREEVIAPTGNVEAKKREKESWSVQENGLYVLFYVRVRGGFKSWVEPADQLEFE